MFGEQTFAQLRTGLTQRVFSQSSFLQEDEEKPGWERQLLLVTVACESEEAVIKQRAAGSFASSVSVWIFCSVSEFRFVSDGWREWQGK